MSHSRFIHFGITLILALVFSNDAFPQPILTLEEAVAEALGDNPQLKAKEASVDAYKAKIGVAKSLEEPMAGVEFYQVPLNTAAVDRAMDIDYSLIQKFPFPGKRSAKKHVAEENYFAEQSSYEVDRLSVQTKTEHAYHELYYAERAFSINKELQSIFSKLASSEQAKYTTGKNFSQNFLKSKVELQRLESEAAQLEAKKIQAQAMLNILRHKNPNEEIHLAELPSQNHPIPSYEELEQRVFQKHPELKMAGYDAAASKESVSLAKKERALPDFQLRGTYVQRFGQIDAWTTEAMITIPFLWGKNRKALQEAQALERESQQKLLSVQDEKLGSLKEAYARLESNKKSYELFKTKVLPNASVALKSAQAAYETGAEDFLNYVDTARAFKEAKLETLQAFIDYHKAITDLKYAVGGEWGEDRGPWTMDHGPKKEGK